MITELNDNRTFTAEGYRQLNVFDHLISQKVRSFRTFSKLLEASYREPNRTKILFYKYYILLYKYYILVVFILILACKILYTY